MVFRHLRDLKLIVKIALVGAVSVVITAVALVGLAVWQSGQYNRLAQSEVDDLINSDLDHIMQGVYNLVRTENEAVQQQVDCNLNVARHVLTSRGGVSLATGNVNWTVTNQLTNKKSKMWLPRMLIGDKQLVYNTSPTIETNVVDEVTQLVGETATIFQRINKEGDMLRVATTVNDNAGKRAIGTYIPAVNPDGTPNPVISSILQEKTYQGRAYVVNAWYLTAYEAIKDKSGKLVGMLYVGVKQKSVESRVRNAILQTKVGKTGYVYVLGGKGEHRGHYIVSQKGERDGEDILESKDSDGSYIIKSIINKAISLKPGQLATERYRWQNPGEHKPRWKIARLAYYEPWDWVIGTSAYEDELQTYRTVLSNGRFKMTSIMSIAGLIITLLVGLLGVFVAWTIAHPVQQMQNAVKAIIDGNLDRVVSVSSNDDIGMLAQAFNVMTSRLNTTMKGLAESEEKYRKIYENALEGLFQTSFEGRFLDCNPAMASMLGYDTPDELIEQVTDIREQLYVRPEDRDTITSIIREYGVSIGNEIQVYHKNKGKIWMSISARMVYDGDGKPSCIEGFLIDINDRKRAEDALLDSEQKLKAVVNGSPIPQFVIDQDHNVIYWNNALEEISGIKAGEIIGTKQHWRAFYNAERPCLADLLIEGNVEKMYQLYGDKCSKSHLIADAYEVKEYFRMMRLEGKWLDFMAAVIRDFNGNIIGAVETLEDITERKMAEEDISWNLAINQALSSLYIPLVTVGASIEKISDAILDKCRELTSSSHGYVAEIDPYTGDMVAYTLTRMMETECKLPGEMRKVRYPRLPNGLFKGLWGHSLNTKESFYTNNPTEHHSCAGIPEGHIEIARFLSVPVLLGSELVGQIALSNSSRDYTDRDLYAVNRVAEFFALAIQRKRVEDHKRDFYNNTIQAATGGKMLLTDREELEVIAGTPASVFEIASEEDFSAIRKYVIEISRSYGMEELRASDYCVAVGEAVTNAIKYAGGGSVSIHILPGAILSIISDQGPGIEAMIIPKVAFVTGYTTAGTLGMGYKIILSVADTVYLATGTDGTTIGIETKFQQAESAPDLNAFSSSW